MIKYHIGKCLMATGSIKRCAILETDEPGLYRKERVIQKDSEGFEYFTLPNLKTQSRFKVFTNRIGDAVNEVIYGDVDGIKVSDIFNYSIVDAVYYIDRERGEKIKQLSIDTWKDVNIKWALQERQGIKYLTSDNLLQYKSKNAKLFETKEDADNYLNLLYIQAYTVLKKFDGCTAENFIDFFSNNIKKEFGIDKVDNVAIIDILFQLCEIDDCSEKLRVISEDEYIPGMKELTDAMQACKRKWS